MCVVFLNYKKHPKYPIQIAANREEQLSRFQLSARPTPGFILAGMDYGPDGKQFYTPGTWFGVSANGMVVAVTNRHDSVLRTDEEIKDSRGVLCLELLKQPNARKAMEHAKNKLYYGAYGGANYIIADSESACIVSSRGPKGFIYRPLSEGLHVITNLDANDKDDERHQRIRWQFQEQQVQDHFRIRAQGILYAPKVLKTQCEDGSGTKCSMIATVDTQSKIDFWLSDKLGEPFRNISGYLV